jgi:hypothetical protein
VNPLTIPASWEADVDTGAGVRMWSGTPDAGKGATGVVRHSEPGAPDSFTRRNIRAPDGIGSVGEQAPIRPDDPAGVSVPTKIGACGRRRRLGRGLRRGLPCDLFAGRRHGVGAQITGFDSPSGRRDGAGPPVSRRG